MAALYNCNLAFVGISTQSHYDPYALTALFADFADMFCEIQLMVDVHPKQHQIVIRFYLSAFDIYLDFLFPFTNYHGPILLKISLQ